VECSSPADSGLKSASTWAFTTDSLLPSIPRLTARLISRTRPWSNSSERSATTSRTTGPHSFLWWNSRTTTQWMLQQGWHHSGPCNIGTPKSSSKHRKCDIYNPTTKQTLRFSDCQGLIGITMRTYWKPSSAKWSTLAEIKLCSRLETQCGYQPSTSAQLGHLRSSTTNARDCTLWVKSSIAMLTN